MGVEGEGVSLSSLWLVCGYGVVGQGVLTVVWLYSRDEEWGSGGGGSTPSGGSGDNKDYDGPAGMDVDGVIESTWTEVSSLAFLFFQHC